MPRFKNENGFDIQLTEDEENARDLEEQSWEVEATDRAFEVLREKRNSKLVETDWTQMPDAPSAGKTVWASYRQDLRDLPANTPDPANPTWPTSPE